MEQSLVYGEASTKELMAFMQRPGLSPANKVSPPDHGSDTCIRCMHLMRCMRCA